MQSPAVKWVRKTLSMILPIAVITAGLSLAPLAAEATPATPTKIKLDFNYVPDEDGTEVMVTADFNGDLATFGGDDEKIELHQTGSSDVQYLHEVGGNQGLLLLERPASGEAKYYATFGGLKSNTITVPSIPSTWQITLKASADEFGTDDDTPSLTWTTLQDLDNSGYKVYVFDVDADSLIGTEDTGKTGTININRFYTGNPREYIAYVAANNTSVTHQSDLTDVQSSSGSQQISRSIWTVKQDFASTQNNEIEITTNQSINDVHTAADHYAVYVLDLTDGNIIAENHTMGTTWNLNLPAAAVSNNHTYVSVVAKYDSSLGTTINPTASLDSQFTDYQASSRYLFLTGSGIEVSLDASTQNEWDDPYVFSTSQPMPNLNWTVSRDLTSTTQYGVYLTDQDGNILDKTHGGYTVNSGTTTGSFVPSRFMYGSKTYTVIVATWDTTATTKNDLQNIQSVSNSIKIKPKRWSVELFYRIPSTPQNGPTIGLNSNQNFTDSTYGPSGYSGYLIDTTDGSILNQTSSGMAWDYSASIPKNQWHDDHAYKIYIAKTDPTAENLTDLTYISGVSPPLKGSDDVWQINLASADWSETPSVYAYLNNQLPDDNHYKVYLTDADTGDIVATDDYGYIYFSLEEWPSAEKHYKAYIAKSDPTAANKDDLTEILAASNIVTLFKPNWTFYGAYLSDANSITWNINRNLDAFPDYQVYLVNADTNQIIKTAADGTNYGNFGIIDVPKVYSTRHYRFYVAEKVANAASLSDIVPLAKSAKITVEASAPKVDLSTKMSNFDSESATPQLTWSTDTSAAFTNGKTVYVLDTTTDEIIGTSNSSAPATSNENAGVLNIKRFYNGTSHTYKAYIADDNAAANSYEDLTGIIATSDPVTVTHKNWTVTLSSNAASNAPHASVLITVNQNVVDAHSSAPTNAVYLVDKTTNTIIAVNKTMGKTTTQILTAQPFEEAHNYQAYIAPYDAAVTQPADIHDVEAQSSVTTVQGQQFGLTIAGPTAAIATNQTFSLNVSSNFAGITGGGPFDYSYYVVDETTGNVVGWKWFLANNVVFDNLNVMNNHKTDTYRAYIAASTWGAATRKDQLTDIIGKSNPVQVTLDTNWTINIPAGTFQYRYGEPKTYSFSLDKPLSSYYALYGVHVETGDVTLINPNYDGINAYYTAPSSVTTEGPQNYKIVIAKRDPSAAKLADLTEIQVDSNNVRFDPVPFQLQFNMQNSGPATNVWGNLDHYNTGFQLLSNQFIPNFLDNVHYSVYLVDEETDDAINLWQCPLTNASYFSVSTNSIYSGVSNTAWSCGGGLSNPYDADHKNGYIDVTHTYRMYIADLYDGVDGQGQPSLLAHPKSAEFEHILAKSDKITPGLNPIWNAPGPDETTGGGNPSEADCSECSQDPINTANGEFYENITDARINNVVPFDFTRSYSSKNATKLGSMGYGWTTNYDMRLKDSGTDHTSTPGLNNANQVTVYQENNSTVVFNKKADGTYTPESPRAQAKLTYDSSADLFTMTRKDGYRFTFNGNGQLKSIRGINDTESLRLAYNTDGTIDFVVAVKDSGATYTDKRLSFTYNGAGLISSVTDETTGLTTTYGYDPSTRDLISVNVPKAVNNIRYTYYDGHLVKDIFSTYGGKTENTYNSDNQVSSQTDPRNNTTTYTYAKTDPTSNNTVTTITYQDGTVDKHYYNSLQQITTLTKAVGTADEASITYAYAGNGQKVSATDPLNHTTRMSYDGDGNMVETIDAKNRSTQFDYNQYGQVTKITDPLQGEHIYHYNANGTLDWEESPSHKITHYTVEDEGYVSKEQDPNGNYVKYGYDTHDYVNKIIDQNDHETSLTNDAAGNPLTVKDDSQNATTYHYDSKGRLDKITYPDGTYTSQTYDDTALTGSGAVESTRDTFGKTTEYTYYPDGSLKSTENEIGKITYFYNQRGWLDHTTSTITGTTTYGYDKRGNVTSITDPQQNVTSYTYYKNDLQHTVTDAENRTTTYGYDEVNNQTTVTDNMGRTSTATYDGLNRLITSTDSSAAHKTTGYKYNADSSINTVYTPDTTDDDIKYQYDDNGNMIQYQAIDGHQESYWYDKANNLIAYSPDHTHQAIQPTSAQYQYTYTNLNQLASSTVNGITTHYTYDTMGNKLTEKTGNPVAVDITYAYDTYNRLQDETKDGVTTHYAYDTKGNLSYRGPPADINGNYSGGVTYNYNNKNQLSSLTYPDNLKIGYEYDPTGNLNKVTKITGTDSNPTTETLADYTLNKTYQATQIVYGNGVTNTIGYDNAGSLSSNTYTTNVAGTTTNLYGESITTDGIGAITSSNTTNGSTSTGKTYNYDIRNQLSKITDVTANPQTQNGYEYDNNGNLTKNQTQTNTYTNNALTQSLTPATKSVYTYDTADAQGRSTSTVSNPSGTTQYSTSNYTWQQDGTLTHVATNYTAAAPTNNEDVNVGYTYDAAGLMVAKTKTVANDITSNSNTNPTTTITSNYTWDESGGLATMLADDTYNYIYADDITPFAQINKDTGAITYLGTDHLGSVNLTTDGNGQKLSTYTYDAYGKQTGDTGDSAHTITHFGYAGQYLDTDTGLYYMRARWYDPTVGSFISVDPMQPQTHETYAYAAGNPITNTDPSGLFSFNDILNNPISQWSANVQTGIYNTISNPTALADAASQVTDAAGQIGFGILDGLTGGISTMIIDAVAPGAINHCSAYFQWSSGITTVVSMFIPGGAVLHAVTAAVHIAVVAVKAIGIATHLASAARGITTALSVEKFTILSGKVIRAGGNSSNVSNAAIKAAGSGIPLESAHTLADLETVTQHLKTLDGGDAFHELYSPYNIDQVNRIRDTLKAGGRLNQGQTNFMNHELKESSLMRAGADYDSAHAEALRLHNFGENYEKEVLQKYSGYFNKLWDSAWGGWR